MRTHFSTWFGHLSSPIARALCVAILLASVAGDADQAGAAAVISVAKLAAKAAPKTKKKAKPVPGGGVATPPASIPLEEPEPVVAAAAGGSPMADLKKSHARLQKLIGKKSPDWSPEADARTAEIRVLVGEFLDFPELAKRSLVAHWDGIPPGKRAAFVRTLRSLVERSYVDQMHGEASYDLKWQKETVSATDAAVRAALTTKRKGKPIEIAMEYKLLHKQRGWVVYDVITDEQSLLETYRAEFNKIIRKESFDALLDRLQKKLDEKVKSQAK